MLLLAPFGRSAAIIIITIFIIIIILIFLLSIERFNRVRTFKKKIEKTL